MKFSSKEETSVVSTIKPTRRKFNPPPRIVDLRNSDENTNLTKKNLIQI